jgi:hypothetical protein
MKARILSGLFVFTVAPLLGQLAAPNADGVRMGHMHLAVKGSSLRDPLAGENRWSDI